MKNILKVVGISAMILFALPQVWLKTANAQVRPLNSQELNISVANGSDSIFVNAIGNLWGTRAGYFPLVDSMQHYHRYNSAAFTFIDRLSGTNGPYFIGYGLYQITVENNSIFVDFRDDDYPIRDYSYLDVFIHYDKTKHQFWRQRQWDWQTVWMSNGGSFGVWQDSNKTTEGPTRDSLGVAFTIQNRIRTGTSDGQVNIQGAAQSSPYNATWNLGDSLHTIGAISPQTVDGLINQYSYWSDGGNQSHQLDVSKDHGTYTAYLTALKPAQVTGITVGGHIGQPVEVTWQVQPNDSVEYYIYRKIRHNGTMGSPAYLATVSHSTTSFQDPDYTEVSYSSDQLYYDIRAHHTPTNTFADPQWIGSAYGIISQNKPVNPSIGAAESGEATCYALDGSYPNPFNPSTNIKYQLPDPGIVRLLVYDILGRQVAELANGVHKAGFYTATWNATSVATGVYYVRYTVIDENGKQQFSKIGKVMLMK